MMLTMLTFLAPYMDSIMRKALVLSGADTVISDGTRSLFSVMILNFTCHWLIVMILLKGLVFPQLPVQ